MVVPKKKKKKKSPRSSAVIKNGCLRKSPHSSAMIKNGRPKKLPDSSAVIKMIVQRNQLTFKPWSLECLKRPSKGRYEEVDIEILTSLKKKVVDDNDAWIWTSQEHSLSLTSIKQNQTWEWGATDESRKIIRLSINVDNLASLIGHQR